MIDVGLRQIAIVGNGIIGSSWAVVFARAGMRVRVWTPTKDRQKAVHTQIASILASLIGTGLEGDDATPGRISLNASFDEVVGDADYVQESVHEVLEVKRSVFDRIEASARPDAILASSTSGILPSEISVSMRSPERFLVVHPLAPPHLIPVTEICPSPECKESVIARTIGLLSSAGQRPVRLNGEIRGFALNRIIGALLNECFALVRDGVVDIADVDSLFTYGLGLRWSVIGPLASMELNAPGGIADYLERYGEIFQTVAKSRGAASVLDCSLMKKIASGLPRPTLAPDAVDRIAQRDRAIAELRRNRRIVE